MPASPIKTYMAWRGKASDVGCVFANFLARNPERHGQTSELITGNDPSRLAMDIATCVVRCISNPAVAAVTIVLPDVTSLDILIKTATELSSQDGWRVTRTRLDATPVGPAVAFAVVRDIPFGAGSCPSEALVLGPFTEFPNTRRAPITAFELFVGTPPTTDPKTGLPPVKANLAQIQIEGIPSQKTFDSMWNASIERRLQSLGVEDARAKARVTFSIPLSLAVSLGCLP